MNRDRKPSSLPSLISNVISDPTNGIDNLFADTWKRLKVNAIIHRSGIAKRSGIEITQALFLLLVWRWLSVSSIYMFSRQSMQTFSESKKDVMYDLLKREDINWREFNLQTAHAVYRQNHLASSKIRAFVLDDSIKSRRGKKMEGVSSHFDHVTGRHIMGQQVLTLGLATEDGFLPLDSQIFISKVNARELIAPHKDGRSIVANRYKEACDHGKPEMSQNMMKRALRQGIEADYLVADAWFGSKRTVRTAVGLDICAILRMKKNKLKYRIKQGRKKTLLTAEEIYTIAIKREWKKVRGLPWKAVEVEVELNLAAKPSDQDHWQAVKLLFVRGLNEPGEPDVGKKDWALFLSTDVQISLSKMLEVYALRWGIEVYFKEAKQHLGFLAEQTWTFASHTASIHLCAIRYLMLLQNKLEGDEQKICTARSEVQKQLNTMSFAGDLWQMFRAVIAGSIDELQDQLKCSADTIMAVIDARIQQFFVDSLQLDAFTMALEHEDCDIC